LLRTLASPVVEQDDSDKDKANGPNQSRSSAPSVVEPQFEPASPSCYHYKYWQGTKLKTSSSCVNIGFSLFDFEGDFTAGDMTVDGQQLPA
jgi:hypothetical protein